MPCTGSDDNSVYSICGEFKVKLGRSRIKGNSFIQIWDVVMMHLYKELLFSSLEQVQ